MPRAVFDVDMALKSQREIRVVRHDVCIRVFIIVVFVVALSPPVLHFEWNSWVVAESERTNVEDDRQSPKKGSPKEHLSVDDDDEGDALPTEVASPKQPQSKAMKTLKVPQHLKLAARSTPTKEPAKGVIELGNDDDADDEDLSRIQRRSKRTKAN